MRRKSTHLTSLKDLRLKKDQVSYDDHPRDSVKLLQGERKMRKKQPIGICNAVEDKIYENFIQKDKDKSYLDETLIAKSLSNHFIFSALLDDTSTQDNLVKKFRYCFLQQNQYLLKQNDEASSFFILDQGVLQVQINKKAKKRIYSGTGFGELALLYSAPRSASIKALKKSFLWYIDRITFKKFVAAIIKRQYSETREFIEKNIFFAFFTKNQKDKIASIVSTQTFNSEEQVFKEGQLAASMYIVKSGKISRFMNGYKFGYLTKGDSFQQFAVLNKGALRRQTGIAQEKTQLLSFGINQIQSVLGRSLHLVLIRNRANKKLLNSQYFSFLPEELRDKLIDCFSIRKIEKEEVVIYEGFKKKDLIFFIFQGEYELSNLEREVQIYGEQAINIENRESQYDFSLEFKTQGKIAFMTINKIEEILKCSFQYAQFQYNQINLMLKTHQEKIIQKRSIFKDYNISNFQKVKKLGEGHFGVVKLVYEKKLKQLYALKCAPKELKGKDITKYLQNEKKVLQNINFPFIVDYYSSFQDDKNFYFLLQFIEGIQLFTAIRQMGLLSLDQTKFFTGIILLSVENLHKNNIIYRDLKPENIMVCKDGYLKLIDMGTCKIMQNGSQRTCTIIGTPCYMAPQILSGKGYGSLADLWSLGIIIFEFMSGYLPFGEDCDDPYQIFQEILLSQINFPEYMKSEVGKAFILQLLSKKPEDRLQGNYQNLKNNAFFQGIQWCDLICKKMKPPYQLPEQILLQNQKEILIQEKQNIN